MVAATIREGAPKSLTPVPLTAARDALARLSTPRKKTGAEQKLDEILRNLQTQKSAAAREAAQRKLERVKAKLEALKLAAGSAAATGDARLARRVAKDIRDAARELGRALADAGSAGGRAVAAAGVSAGSDQAPQVAKPAGDDLATLKSEAAGLVKELRKIMRKLRVTALHRQPARKDRAEMEKMFGEADRELMALQAAAAPSPGMRVDLAV